MNGPFLPEERFLGKHIQGLEEDLHRHDQTGLFRRIKSLKARRRLARSTSVMKRAECCETQGLSSEGGRDSPAPLPSQRKL